MHHIELVGNRKGILGYIIFFLMLLTMVGISYYQSKMLIDMIYFLVVFISFIRCLIVKLYQ